MDANISLIFGTRQFFLDTNKDGQLMAILFPKFVLKHIYQLSVDKDST